MTQKKNGYTLLGMAAVLAGLTACSPGSGTTNSTDQKGPLKAVSVSMYDGAAGAVNPSGGGNPPRLVLSGTTTGCANAGYADGTSWSISTNPTTGTTSMSLTGGTNPVASFLIDQNNTTCTLQLNSGTYNSRVYSFATPYDIQASTADPPAFQATGTSAAASNGSVLMISAKFSSLWSGAGPSLALVYNMSTSVMPSTGVAVVSSPNPSATNVLPPAYAIGAGNFLLSYTVDNKGDYLWDIEKLVASPLSIAAQTGEDYILLRTAGADIANPLIAQNPGIAGCGDRGNGDNSGCTNDALNRIYTALQSAGPTPTTVTFATGPSVMVEQLAGGLMTATNTVSLSAVRNNGDSDFLGYPNIANGAPGIDQAGTQQATRYLIIRHTSGTGPAAVSAYQMFILDAGKI